MAILIHNNIKYHREKIDINANPRNIQFFFVTSIMQIIIYIQNVEGLNNPIFIDVIKNYYFLLIYKLNAICF